MSKPKRADLYKTGDDFPRWYPWLPQTVVTRRDLDTDPDTGIANLVHITLRSGDVFTARPDEIMYMPRRPDGLNRIFTEFQKTKDLCRGDEIPDPKDPSNHYTIISMRAHTPTDQDRVVVLSLDHATQQLNRSLGNRYEIFIPGREPYVERLSKVARQIHSHRGPYLDITESSVQNDKRIFYTLLVHPTGRGRWPAGTDKFQFRVENGTYTSRPPAAGDEHIWENLKFVGDNKDDRHPYDPNVIKEASSRAWDQYKIDNPGRW